MASIKTEIHLAKRCGDTARVASLQADAARIHEEAGVAAQLIDVNRGREKASAELAAKVVAGLRACGEVATARRMDRQHAKQRRRHDSQLRRAVRKLGRSARRMAVITASAKTPRLLRQPATTSKRPAQRTRQRRSPRARRPVRRAAAKADGSDGDGDGGDGDPPLGSPLENNEWSSLTVSARAATERDTLARDAADLEAERAFLRTIFRREDFFMHIEVAEKFSKSEAADRVRRLVADQCRCLPKAKAVAIVDTITKLPSSLWSVAADFYVVSAVTEGAWLQWDGNEPRLDRGELGACDFLDVVSCVVDDFASGQIDLALAKTRLRAIVFGAVALLGAPDSVRDEFFRLAEAAMRDFLPTQWLDVARHFAAIVTIPQAVN